MQIRLHYSRLVDGHFHGDTKDNVVAVKVAACDIVFHTHPHHVLMLVNEASEIPVLVNHVHPLRRITCSHEVVAGGVGPYAISDKPVVLVGAWGHVPSVIESYAHPLGNVHFKGNASKCCDAFAISFVGSHTAIGVVVGTQSPCGV